jgi:hypothetical protein
MNELNAVAQLFQLSDEITRLKCDQIQNCFELVDEYAVKHSEELIKLPYHINLLDLVRVNENAHSRIFARLLEKKNDFGEYPILQSLYKFLNQQFKQFEYTIKSPAISVEKDRIDMLILEDDHAVIIENKIHGAVDQGGQLARYINRVRNRGYHDTQIFIIYLTRDGTKTENDYTWTINGTSFKQQFKGRYLRISYRYHILPLLKDHILPSCRSHDVFLQSSVIQYIDYLEGMFNKRKISMAMNKELNDFIKEKIGLKDSLDENRNILQDKLATIQNIEQNIKELLLENEMAYYETWFKQLKADFPEHQVIREIDDDGFRNVGLVLKTGRTMFSVLIETNMTDDYTYFGIGKHEATETKVRKIIQQFRYLLNDDFIEDQDDVYWYYYKETSLNKGYRDLKHLITDVLDVIE